jgi:hypothetical protein
MRTTVPLVAMALCTLSVPVRAAAFDAAAYGARGDGTTVNTAAIQKAIDAAAKAGGGVVAFQPGVYLSGALFLKSRTELRLDEGVEIRGVQDLAAYPVMLTRVAGIEMPWPSALINVYRQAHVRIGGKGIRAQGTALGGGLRLPAPAADPGLPIDRHRRAGADAQAVGLLDGAHLLFRARHGGRLDDPQ